MKRTKFRILFAGVLLTAISVAASAGQPQSVDKDRGSDGPFIDPVLTNWCGTEILVTFEWKTKTTYFDDGMNRLHVNYDWIMFNPANGATVIETGAFNVTTPPVMELVDENLGTLTLIFEETTMGVPLKWRQPGVGVLLRDAGTVNFQLTLMFDLSTEELLDESFSADTNGPHPSLFMSEPEMADIICGALME